MTIAMKRMAVSAAVAIGLLIVDRYSRGLTGEGVSEFGWQRWVALLLGCTLTAATALAYRSRRLAAHLFTVELAGFLFVNAHYFDRDGFGRLFWGFDHSPWGLVIVLGGLVARWNCLRGLLERTRNLETVGDPYRQV